MPHSTAPLIQLADVWRAIRDRMRASASVLVFGENRSDTDAITSMFAGSGMTVLAAASLPEAERLIQAHAPEVRLIALSEPLDALQSLIAATDESFGFPTIAVVRTHDEALRAFEMGADDALIRPLPKAERLHHVVRARIRQGVTLRLSTKMAEELWGQLGVQREDERVSDLFNEIEQVLSIHRTALESRGTRLLVVDSDAERLARTTTAVVPLRAAVVTAASAGDALDVLRMAIVDAALIHVEAEGMPAAHLVTQMHDIDPYLQMVLLEGTPSSGTNEALARAAVAVQQDDWAPELLSSLLRRLIVIRRSLDMLRKFTDEVARRDPSALSVAHRLWRTAAFVPVGNVDRPPERRIDARSAFEYPVVLQSEGSGETLEGTTLNLSLSGMFVATTTPLDEGTRVACQILVESTVLKIDGEVVRRGDALAGDGGTQDGFGVWFPQVNAETIRFLTAMLRKSLAG